MKNPNYVVIYVVSVLLVLVFIALSNYKIEMVRLRSATDEKIKTRQDTNDVTDLSQADLIKDLTDLLLYRLSQPNNAAKILFTESCDFVASKWSKFSSQNGQNSLLRMVKTLFSEWSKFSSQNGQNSLLRMVKILFSGWSKFSSQNGQNSLLRMVKNLFSEWSKFSSQNG
ncbi:hypothetical protein Bpfe_005706 [Biomphalaria pfeifferi]|uniref:Uncharacterized protein n=1 Tax=Biomphalaria pfeifferi TaxID=112525 RepID=A0AAD8C182_BIOPF|nr:hypothetical protein Bpfe_005706 [Biomphalaria pfeifferi]